MTRKLPKITPPVAATEPRSFHIHGETYIDHYAYLRDHTDPRVEMYIAAENAYTAAMTTTWRGFQNTLFAELTRRMVEDDNTVPEHINEYWYYARVEAGKEYPLHCRRAGLNAPEQVYLDENNLADGRDYFDLATLSVCPRHKLVAFVVDTQGDERYRLRINDISNKEPLDDEIHNVGQDLVWLEDANTLLYTKTDANSRPYAVYAHRIGTPVSSDRLLFEEAEPAFLVNVWKSRSKDYVFIEAQSNTTSEVHCVEARESDRAPRLIRQRQTDVEYYLDHHGDRFYVLTNLDAPNFKMMETSISNPQVWRVWIPERPDSTIEFLEVFADYVVVGERQQGIEHLRVIDMKTEKAHIIAFPDALFCVDVEDLDDYHCAFLRMNYSSLVTPECVIDYDVSSRQRRLRKQQKVPDYDESNYQLGRLYSINDRGIRVPISILHRKELCLDGSHPLLLVGYGAYEESLDVDFNSDYLSLLDRGVVIALAHVRGGGELGYDWYEQGRLGNKEHSFSDFLDCAEYLISSGYTAAGKIAAWGASAGGLLVAVAAQRRPELFAAVVAEMPFVDIVNTLMDRSLPLTVHDYEEFGNPANEGEYRYLRRYSPYDNVSAQQYPPMLITAGLHDQRVGYWESLKWVAKLRNLKTDDNLLLLKIDTTGHYGETGRYQDLKRTAFFYSFLLNMWGLGDDDHPC
jgi:oligopeptidase B